MASTDEARTDTATGDLLGPAWSLRWRAPEVALLFAERAGAVAKLAGEGVDRLRAETTVVFASCRLGRQLDVVERAVSAIRLAERQTDAATAAMLRVELAGCARAAGVPLVGAAILRPVLTSDDVRPATRADALVRLVGCLAQLVDGAALDNALADADRLYADDRDLDSDGRVVMRALLRSVASAEQRRRGDARAAVDAAQEGAGLLAAVQRPTADNGAAAARIALRLAHGLLDLGRIDEAAAVATAELARPVRAPAASAIGWLGLTIAVRDHLAHGDPVPALALLADAADLAERHRLWTLRAEALACLSDAHERLGQLPEALDCLRTAQGVRLRRARAVYAARTKLVGAFGETAGPEDFVALLGGATVRRAADTRGRTGRENAAVLLGRFGMRRPIDAAVDSAVDPAAGSTTPGASKDVTMVLVDLASTEPDEQVVRQVLDRVRDAAPVDAQVARVGGAEFAVLLPATRSGQAERWVTELRAAMGAVDWTTVAPGATVDVRVTVAQQTGRRATEPVRTPEPARALESARTAERVGARKSARAAESVGTWESARAAEPGRTAGSGHRAESGRVPEPVRRPEPVSAPAPEAAEQRADRSAEPALSGVTRVGAPHGDASSSPRDPDITQSRSIAAPSMFELPTVPIMPVGIGSGLVVERSSGQLPAVGGSPQRQARPGAAAVPIPFEPALYVDPVEPPPPAVPDEPVRAETRPPEPFLPALPIPPRLEPAHPVSSSPVFHRGGSASGGGDFGGGGVPVSADPSVRISAADIAAADRGESRPRHAVDAEAGSSVLSNLGISGRSGGGGRRRARDESEPEPARAPAEPASPPAEPPNRPVQPPALRIEPPVADTSERAVRPEPPGEPQPATAAPRVGGKRRRSVQLADLLTEAMMAYQSTQDSTETTSATSSAELPAPQVRPVGLDPAVGDEPGFPGSARHRGDTQSGDSRWLGARWDKPGDRS